MKTIRHATDEELAAELERRHRDRQRLAEASETVAGAIAAVSKAWGLPVADIHGPQRVSAAVTDARHMAWRLCLSAGMSKQKIRRVFGWPGHGTVSHGLRSIAARIDTDPATRISANLAGKIFSLNA